MEIFETLKEFIKPELTILIPVLLFIGFALKHTDKPNNKHIPLILGLVGVLLASLWVLATASITTWQNVLLAVFTALVQGMLCAAGAVYIHQLKKQTAKNNPEA